MGRPAQHKRRNTMAIIGIFTKQEDGGFHGTIETLTLNLHATFNI
jgi:uncharacterized protein (DUF736 family)